MAVAVDGSACWPDRDVFLVPRSLDHGGAICTGSNGMSRDGLALTVHEATSLIPATRR